MRKYVCWGIAYHFRGSHVEITAADDARIF
jgi:hypothetical protein